MYYNQYNQNYLIVIHSLIYLFVFLLIVVDVASIWWAWSTGAAFMEAIPMVFDADEMQILASIIAFWFGTQAFAKK